MRYEADEKRHGIGEVESFRSDSDDGIEACNGTEIDRVERHLDDGP